MGPSIKAVLVESPPEVRPSMVRPDYDRSYQSTVLLNQQPQSLRVVQLSHRVNVEVVVAVQVLDIHIKESKQAKSDIRYVGTPIIS